MGKDSAPAASSTSPSRSPIDEAPIEDWADRSAGGTDESRRGKAQWLNRNVIGMGLTSFLSDAGHEVATAILPLFMAAIHAPAAALGVIEGLADAVSSFAKLGAGWLGDRVERRKPMIVGGYTG